MCFSPEADLAAAVVVGAIGVATLRLVRSLRELLIGALPLLFALHQFVESFVWLGLRGQVSSGLGQAATDAYVIFAYPVLPIIVPLGFLLLEPSARHRRWLVPFVVLGAAVGAYLMWRVTQYPVVAVAHDAGVAYITDLPLGVVAGVGYVVATCGPALLSSRRYLQWFGLLNLVTAMVVFTVQSATFASVWCLYAALASLLIFEHFRRERSLHHRVAASAV